MTDRNALPECWPEPPTDPPDDDPDAREAFGDWHDCDDDERCEPCIPCYMLTGETVCQFTCGHRKDME